MLPLPSPPPPPSIPTAATAAAAATGILRLIIAFGIIAFAALTLASLHLLCFLLSRRRSSSAVELPLPAAVEAPRSSHWDQLISSLPVFSLASPATATSSDCAVCLSPFLPTDELLHLPNCRHAFHLRCINTWLQSTPSCPLCRSSVTLSPNPAQDGRGLRTELGSVSRRRMPDEGSGGAGDSGAVIGCSYSMGSSVEHFVGDQVERVGRRMGAEKEESGSRGGGDPVAEVAEAGGTGWLREYFEWVASSASSSFNSLRFSGSLGSQRFDSDAAADAASATADDGRSWDMEGAEWVEQSGLAGIYRWLAEI